MARQLINPLNYHCIYHQKTYSYDEKEKNNNRMRPQRAATHNRFEIGCKDGELGSRGNTYTTDMDLLQNQIVCGVERIDA